MTLLTYIYIAGGMLVLGLIFYFFFKRNYFNKYKYIRLEKFNNDKSISVKYIKRHKFGEIPMLINPAHIFNYKGYTSIMTTSEVAESINPLDFSSKYDGKKFKIGMKTKLIGDAFGSISKPKIDMLMVSVALNAVTIMILLYMFYMGGA